MKKIILGVGITVFGSFGLVASENTGNAGNPAVPRKTREAFAAGSRDIVRRASQELEKRTNGPLSCSAEIKTSTEALRKATLDMDYGFPHSNRAITPVHEDRQSFNHHFYNDCP